MGENSKTHYRTYFKLKCLNCGNEYESRLTYVERGCPKCNHKKGKKNITEREPWMIKYFIGGEDEAKMYLPSSTKKIDMKCPYCGNIIRKQISVLYNLHSLGCTCGDSVSVPEKYVYALLKSLKIEFIWQASKKVLSWIDNNIKYDFYLPKYNYIIETHGGQHYIKQNRHNCRTLEEEQMNDNYKQSLAINNGVKKYIVIDCRDSHANRMKDNILNSNLLQALNIDLGTIDWQYCLEKCTTNLVKDVCNYYNNHLDTSVTEMANVFKLNRSTIRNFLIQGNNLNWCNYDGNELRNKACRKRGVKNSKPIEVTKDDITIGLFFNVGKLVKYSEQSLSKKLSRTCIMRCCNNPDKIYQGYKFKYITQEEYNNREENKGCLNLNLV